MYLRVFFNENKLHFFFTYSFFYLPISRIKRWCNTLFVDILRCIMKYLRNNKLQNVFLIQKFESFNTRIFLFVLFIRHSRVSFFFNLSDSMYVVAIIVFLKQKMCQSCKERNFDLSLICNYSLTDFSFETDYLFFKKKSFNKTEKDMLTLVNFYNADDWTYWKKKANLIYTLIYIFNFITFMF